MFVEFCITIEVPDYEGEEMPPEMKEALDSMLTSMETIANESDFPLNDAVYEEM